MAVRKNSGVKGGRSSCGHKIPTRYTFFTHPDMPKMERLQITVDYIRDFDVLNHFKHCEYQMFDTRITIV